MNLLAESTGILRTEFSWISLAGRTVIEFLSFWLILGLILFTKLLLNRYHIWDHLI